MKIEKLVPDTSVIIEGVISKQLSRKEIEVTQILIHEALLSELEHQSNQGRAIGMIGLDEIKAIQKLADIKFMGLRPKASEIKYASLGEIDSLIRTLAYEEDATLMTGDNVQAKVAEAKAMKVIYIEPSKKEKRLKLDKYFDPFTMSVHLRENVIPAAKKGAPGKWDFVQLKDKPIKQKELIEISREIIEESKRREDAFIEIEREGSTIVQLGSYRIVITKPAFSDGWEITAVRPVKKLSLADYKLNEKLLTRLDEQAEGILVAGSPGMGKSTFASALAEHYGNKNKIVKTVEAPRDLVLPDSITQYALSHGDAQEIHDILLLSRPDYTIFDEMRNTNDFTLFADMRLAGVGMVGIVHATSPVDAIQRFIGRIEMGVIPQVIDTVVFIKDGAVNKILNLKMLVKVPSGMTEADLARPVVAISDFETNKLEYEIYSYGEQTVVIPVTGKEKSTGTDRLAAEAIERHFKKITDDVKVEITSPNKCTVYVPEEFIARIIGKAGKNIEGLENSLGIGIDIQELKEQESGKEAAGKEIEFEAKITKKAVIFYLNPSMKDNNIQIYIDDDFLMATKASKKALIKIHRKNKLGKLLVDEINDNGNVRLLS